MHGVVLGTGIQWLQSQAKAFHDALCSERQCITYRGDPHWSSRAVSCNNFTCVKLRRLVPTTSITPLPNIRPSSSKDPLPGPASATSPRYQSPQHMQVMWGLQNSGFEVLHVAGIPKAVAHIINHAQQSQLRSICSPRRVQHTMHTRNTPHDVTSWDFREAIGSNDVGAGRWGEDQCRNSQDVGPWLDLAGLSERENSPRSRQTLCDWPSNSHSQLHCLHGQRRKCSDGRASIPCAEQAVAAAAPCEAFQLEHACITWRSLGLQSLTSWPCRRTLSRRFWGTQGWRCGSQAVILAGGERPEPGAPIGTNLELPERRPLPKAGV